MDFKQSIFIQILKQINFHIKYIINSTKRIDFIEKQIVANSSYWDDLWYIKTYNHNFTRKEALNYWYKKGWLKGENPSKYINTKYCLHRCNGQNPILAYLNKDLVFFPDNKNNYKDKSDATKITEYLEYKQTRKAKSVIYTSITNDYDDIREIETHKYIDKDWDYVCFSDNEDLIKQGQVGIWEIKPLQFCEKDSIRNQRWHKMFAHILFPEYEESIYIDGNINILSPYLFDLVKNTEKIFLQPKHFKNLCIYGEYKDVLSKRLDKRELIKKERDFIKNEGMPRNYGFGENNILYRKHHHQQIKNIMNDWWNMLSDYAKRDQLSLAYLLWKNNIKLEEHTFENARFQTDNFYIFGHKKGWPK